MDPFAQPLPSPKAFISVANRELILVHYPCTHQRRLPLSIRIIHTWVWCRSRNKAMIIWCWISWSWWSGNGRNNSIGTEPCTNVQRRNSKDATMDISLALPNLTACLPAWSRSLIFRCAGTIFNIRSFSVCCCSTCAQLMNVPLSRLVYVNYSDLLREGRNLHEGEDPKTWRNRVPTVFFVEKKTFATNRTRTGRRELVPRGLPVTFLCMYNSP